jgi:small subunit ribosomal protein S7
MPRRDFDKEEKGAPLQLQIQIQAVPPAPVLPIKAPLVFGKYSMENVVVKDNGLRRYINLNPVIIPHTDAKYANRKFGKAKQNIVERIINGLMRTGRYQGKKAKSYTVVKEAFGILEAKTKTNPVQVLIYAIENAAPRDETTRLIFGGISVAKAVDISPSRRLDIAVRSICMGAVSATRKNRKPVAECFADEVIMASKNDVNSFAIRKKDEIERVAQSAW